MSTIAQGGRPGSFFRSLAVQGRVIGALILRDLHTRYGRDNIGYMWMVGEPMMLATVIGLLHAESGHTAYGSDVRPLPFAVLGYTLFIVFRGIVNRSEGGVEGSATLFYHKQVTIMDIVLARAVLDLCGVFLTFVILMSIIINLGMAALPVRPLALAAAWLLVFWYSLGHAFLIEALSFENRLVGRFVHPYSYFMVGLSGAFTPLASLPKTFREILSWVPLTNVFELARYGQFESSNLDYFYPSYIIGACFALTIAGLILMKSVRDHVHLS